jgi:hypothetical protein
VARNEASSQDSQEYGTRKAKTEQARCPEGVSQPRRNYYIRLNVNCLQGRARLHRKRKGPRTNKTEYENAGTGREGKAQKTMDDRDGRMVNTSRQRRH